MPSGYVAGLEGLVLVGPAVLEVGGVPWAVSRGAPRVEPITVEENVPFDGKPGPVAGFDVVYETGVRITGTWLEFGPDHLTDLLQGSAGVLVGGVTTFEPRPAYGVYGVATHYLADVAVIGKRSDGQRVRISLPIAEVRSHEVTSTDRSTATLAMTIEARADGATADIEGPPYVIELVDAAALLPIEQLTASSEGAAFTRSSARTHPRTGAELAVDVPVTETITEAVAINPRVLSWGDGLRYVGIYPVGEHAGKHLFSGTHEGTVGLFLNTDGVSEPTLWPGMTGVNIDRIMPNGNLLRTPSVPTHIFVRDVSDLSVEIDTGFVFEDIGKIGTQGVSGPAALAKAAGGTFESFGAVAWIVAYSNDFPQHSYEIYRTDDNGLTWAKVYEFPNDPDQHLHAVVYDELTGLLYVAAGDAPGSAVTGVHVSANPFAALGVMSFTKLTGLLPIALQRMGDRIVGGGDMVPTSVVLMQPGATTPETALPVNVAFDKYSTVMPVASGPIYDMAWNDDVAYFCLSQGHDVDGFHNTVVTQDFVNFYPILSALTGGWGQPAPLANGGMLFKPQGGGIITGNFVAIDGVEFVTRSAVRVDRAVGPVVNPSTLPMTSANWTFIGAGGEWVEGGGPGGARAAKIGGLWSGNAGKLAVSAGQKVTVAFDALASVAFVGAEELQLNVTYYDAGGVFVENAQRGVAGFYFTTTDWMRCREEFTVPATAGIASCDIGISLANAVYNPASTYMLLSYVTMFVGEQTEPDSHVRALETFEVVRAVGPRFAVFDRVHPTFDTELVTDVRILMRLIDVADEDSYLQVAFNADPAAKRFEVKRYAAGVPVVELNASAIRSYGSFGWHHWSNSPGTMRAVRFAHDGLSFGLEVVDGVATAVIWDRYNTAVASFALGAFAPASVRIRCMAADAAHALTLVTDAVDPSVRPALLLTGTT